MEERCEMQPITDSPIVYVVDDHASNRELISDFLEDLGCEVQLFASGEDALNAAAARAPDVVVLDIMMPRLSGYQVCERLRSEPSTAQAGVIMLTALNETADVERALEAGATDFLIKPVQRQELVARVQSLLAHRELSARVDSAVAKLIATF
ncbi:MAG: response regulator [Planctomycetota bacterium]